MRVANLNSFSENQPDRSFQGANNTKSIGIEHALDFVRIGGFRESKRQ